MLDELEKELKSHLEVEVTPMHPEASTTASPKSLTTALAAFQGGSKVGPNISAYSRAEKTGHEIAIASTTKRGGRNSCMAFAWSGRR